ncbi:MAG TPA: hypothetical protein VGW12_14895 [Pyrinomonadaceae bacterium]|nr:hypothetical protein [Pyrinomonadaceae bacterium]
MSCYIATRPHQPSPGEVWASGHNATGWSDLGFALLIAAGGFTVAAIRFIYYKAD